MASTRPLDDAPCGLWELPAELMAMVLDDVESLDLVSLSRTNRSFRIYLQTQERYLAQRITAKHSRRLEEALARLDFRGMGLLPALQTFLSVTGAAHDRNAGSDLHPSRAWILDFAACYARTNEAALGRAHRGWLTPQESIATMVREMLVVQIQLERQMPVEARRAQDAAWRKVRRRWGRLFKGLVHLWWPDYGWDEGELDDIYAHLADHRLFGPGYDLATRPVARDDRLEPERHVWSLWWRAEMGRCHYALICNGHVAQAPDPEASQMRSLSYCCRDMTAGLRWAVQTMGVDEMPPLMIAALFERAELCMLA